MNIDILYFILLLVVSLNATYPLVCLRAISRNQVTRRQHELGHRPLARTYPST